MNNVNTEVLMKNCENIAKKDIRFNGYNWKAHRYYYEAMKAFQNEAVEIFSLECDIVIPDYGIIEGVVRMHRDGRVYPMSMDSYKALFGWRM